MSAFAPPQEEFDNQWRQRAKLGLIPFMSRTTRNYIRSRPHQILCPYLDRFAKGEIRRLMIFMPRRHGKTIAVSVALPAFFLGHFPDLRVMAASHTDTLASLNNRNCQRIMETEEYKRIFPDSQLAERGRGGGAKRTDDYFELVGRDGAYRSAGIGTGIVGQGFDMGIIDDYCRTRADAYSQTVRDKTYEWFSSEFWPCQHPDARILITCTRWHDDDLAGRLLKEAAEDPDAEQWTVVKLPGVCEDTKTLHTDDKRQYGEALWPERYDIDYFIKARQRLGSTMFSAMMQQNPVVAGGNHFKEAWFPPKRPGYLDAGDYWLVGMQRYHKDDCIVFVTCDPAASEKETADHTAILVWAVSPVQDLLLLHVVNERLDIDQIVPTLALVCKDWSPAFVVFENTGFQLALVRDARRKLGLPVREYDPRGKGKLPRATPAIIMAESGKLLLPNDAPWLKTVVDQLTRFTGLDDAEDDIVDNFSQACEQVPRLYNEPKTEQRKPPPVPLTKRPSNAGARGMWGRNK